MRCGGHYGGESGGSGGEEGGREEAEVNKNLGCSHVLTVDRARHGQDGQGTNGKHPGAAIAAVTCLL